MKRVCMRLLSLLLVVSVMLSVTPTVFAVDDELYLSELRLVYAEDYDTAREILDDGEFKDYELLDENLNEDTDEIGVWLAYKTTDDIDDAITDLAIMQMNGGYKQGNYQEMIKESLKEYEDMGKKYEIVIDYFNSAYDEGYFLADIARRQLNIYTVKTIGLDKKYVPSFEGELLGDIFYDGLGYKELATMFMEGNSYVLNNIRSLLAMGVSYNEDGLTYMEKVAEAAAEMNDDPEIYADEDYDSVAKNMVTTLLAIKEMFKEFAVYEDELNFNDEDVTDEELEYAEAKTLANMMRDVDYLDGETLYDFVLNYNGDKSDYSKLYPLVAALNEAQVELVGLLSYYSVIRYSMAQFPEDYLESEVAALEEQYAENPFNIYEGVDRTVFKGTFALTTDAYRADAYNDEDTLADAFFGNALRAVATGAEITLAAGGIGIMIWGAVERSAENAVVPPSEGQLLINAQNAFKAKYDSALNAVASQEVGYGNSSSCGDYLNSLMTKYFDEIDTSSMTFSDKFTYIHNHTYDLKGADSFHFSHVESNYCSAKHMFNQANNKEQYIQDYVYAANNPGMAFSTMLFIAGGAMLLASVVSMAISIISYYNPGYDDVPLSMVDLLETEHGDRYIKYDVVREAEPKDDGSYAAADLNAFEAQRWNALYYTKSYEAGQPLLADEFEVSSNNHFADDGYTPVHRFGEEVCYDLNKYNFDNDTPSIYLSVRQSENEKSAVADVPDVVGSVFSTGLLFLAGGIGAIAGIGGTLATLSFSKKKKKEDEDEES